MTVARAARRIRAALLALILVAGLAPTAVQAADSTAPVGTATLAGYEADDRPIFALSFSDPESGVTSVGISCAAGPEAIFPYESTIVVDGFDMETGGCPDEARHTFHIRAINGDGLSKTVDVLAWVELAVRLEFPLPARTGEPFTIRPVFSRGYTLWPNSRCTWEFRWGSTKALLDNKFDETFGGLYFEGTAANGFCDEWTFTLPWVPVPQFELSFDGPGSIVKVGTRADRLIKAAVVGTDRRIHESSHPIVQILPSSYAPVVGQPVTYTRYFVGGATNCCPAVWTARLGSGENPIIWEKWTKSATFTITPPTTGPILVNWHRDDPNGVLAAYYDPPVRRADRIRPNTSAPIVRFGTGEVDDTVPVKVSWSGTDTGWGIGSYKLQQSTNGGPWQTVTLPRPKATSITRRLAPNTAYRFRVRAIDKAGNRGAWDEGPTTRPKTVSEASPKIAYTKTWTIDPDPTARGGALTESVVTGAKATYTFRGRDIAWLAERGPGHGKAKVYIDGRLISVVDLEAASDQPRRIVLSRHFSSVGTHTIRIVVSGTAGRPIVSLDGFLRLR